MADFTWTEGLKFRDSEVFRGDNLQVDKAARASERYDFNSGAVSRFLTER